MCKETNVDLGAVIAYTDLILERLPKGTPSNIVVRVTLPKCT
jgi:hypothetical protein